MQCYRASFAIENSARGNFEDFVNPGEWEKANLSADPCAVGGKLSDDGSAPAGCSLNNCEK